MAARMQASSRSLRRLDICAVAATAATGVAAMAASLAVESGIGGALAAGLVLIVGAIAVVDGRKYIIPDELNAAGIVLGLAHAAVTNASLIEGVVLAMARGAALAVAFFAIRFAYRRLRGRDGLGLGDVKLAAMAGVWLDWTMIPIAIDLAAGSALVAYALRQFAVGRSFEMTGRLPFGLFFAPAIWVGWILERCFVAGS